MHVTINKKRGHESEREEGGMGEFEQGKGNNIIIASIKSKWKKF